MMKRELSIEEKAHLLETLKGRFLKNMHSHKNIDWAGVLNRLESAPDKLWSLQKMEDTGGEPDIVGIDGASGAYLFYDCAAESPKGRRSTCYDPQALNERKENKPDNSALGLAEEMGIKILNEEQYRKLQQLEVFDAKTSSWIETPATIRDLGGALFADYRYATVFVYHNGAQSYYAARGFRGELRV
jgi:hypothetical protein